MQSPHVPEKLYNAIWLSDLHLGYKGCRAEFALEKTRAGLMRTP